MSKQDRRSKFNDEVRPRYDQKHGSNQRAVSLRVQLKTIDLAKPTDKPRIFEITFRELNAPLIRLTTTKTGYYAVTDDVTSIDKLTFKKGITAFEKINLTPIITPDLRAKSTAFVRQIDADIGLKPTEEIKNEIKNNDLLTIKLHGGSMRPEIPPSIFNVPASCLPSRKPAPRPAKVEDQQLRYFLQKDKITSFDAFKPERCYEQLRDFFVRPCKRKLQYITSSIDKDEVLRETFDKVQTLQQKKVLLLVDEVHIRLNAEECSPSSDLCKEGLVG
ncbi:hypothetical protein FHG87_019619 [Trinorchestia longiramus]|nr:hypothetical protein FHG87_019619 [Trinorchestia longiramus]